MLKSSVFIICRVHGFPACDITELTQVSTSTTSMCHEQNAISLPALPAAAPRQNTRVIQENGSNATTCERNYPAPTKFTRKTATRGGRPASPQHAIVASQSNKDFQSIASCRSALGRSIVSDEPALWDRNSALNTMPLNYGSLCRLEMN